MFSSFFKKKTREEHVEKRTESVLAELLGTAEFDFTELESVQIINNVRRRLCEELKFKKAYYLELSANYQQKAKEIENALEYIE